jgi:hypothetical protein
MFHGESVQVQNQVLFVSTVQQIGKCENVTLHLHKEHLDIK